ncbi:MAG: TIGR03862 family flavoprotein [Rhodoferax sp.]|nr:TIGR03862 family flavoprotein [Rhodoferax sp.]
MSGTSAGAATAPVPRVAVIGGGPAGLMAAEVLSKAGSALSVHVFDAMPSVGRKFLLAGKGGLNLTHAEPAASFNTRYAEAAGALAPMLSAFGADELRQWTHDLGIETFVGSSGRVFPKDMKAAPLLRHWLHRLRAAGVQFSMRHRWNGWSDSGALRFASPGGELDLQADAVVLALGGGSWSRLGSDGAWVPWLQQQGVSVAPLRPSNCGFDVAAWSRHFSNRFAGQPFKSVAIAFTDSLGHEFTRRGEFVATETGLEGSLIYAASSWLREEISRSGSATLRLDLLPDKSAAQVLADVSHPRGSRSLSSHLKSRLGLDGIKAAILHELLDKSVMADAASLAVAIKALPVTLVRARPLEEAISSAGGVRFSDLSADLQVQGLATAQAVFCAGEMLDWEAPTGGYLMTACMASGRRAGQGVLRHLGLWSAA